MAKARALVGLDVHAAKVVAAILDAETGELRFQRLGGESRPVVELCESLAGPVRATYEAGPTGYGLARALKAAGVSCVVAAPGKIPRGATDELKTDRRDAEHLVRLLMAGKLHPVRVPGPAEEALRDLVRAREDVRQDLMRARHRLSKLLLRHEVRFEGRAWTERHRVWLAKVELSYDTRVIACSEAREDRHDPPPDERPIHAARITAGARMPMRSPAAAYSRSATSGTGRRRCSSAVRTVRRYEVCPL